MTVKEYWQQFGVIHDEEHCNVCDNLSYSKPIRAHLSFWIVLDIILLIIAGIGLYTYAIWIIQSLVK
jgi:hypothetical protein